MKRTTLILILVLAALIPLELHSEGDHSLLIERAMKGQELIFARQYADAERVFGEINTEWPDSPAGDFGLMALYEMRMLEKEDFHLENEYIPVAKRGTKKVSQVMQIQRPDTWDLFLAGSLLGLDGFFKARKGKWLDAYIAGTKSRQIFKHVKELDPSFVDADFGLGMYIYWRSVFMHELNFLRMFPDKRNEGIAIVEKVAKDGHFSKDLAKVNLAVMYFEEKRFTDAKLILDEYVSRFPNNLILRKLLGKACVALKQYDEAITHFKKMLSVDPGTTKPHYFIGAALVLKGDPKKFAEAESELKIFLDKESGKGSYWPASAHFWLARLAEAKGELDKARSEYEEAVKLYPKIYDAQKKLRGLGGGL